MDERNTATSYTTAPESYDGFGAVRTPTEWDYHGKPLFRIVIPEEHAGWYGGRVLSGLYPCIPDWSFEEMVREKHFALTIREENAR